MNHDLWMAVAFKDISCSNLIRQNENVQSSEDTLSKNLFMAPLVYVPAAFGQQWLIAPRGVGLSHDRFVCGHAVFWQSEQTVQKDGALGIRGINITPCQNCSGLFQYQLVCSLSGLRPFKRGFFFSLFKNWNITTIKSFSKLR